MIREPAPATAPPAWQAHVPDQVVVYAVGDVHGRADLLAELHEAVVRDAHSRPATRRVLVYLGDYISRARQGRRVIELLRGSGPQGFESVRLMGNHERLVLSFIDGNLPAGAMWLAHGGDALLQEYGVEPPASADAGDGCLESVRQQLRAALPPEHEAFMRSLRLFHDEGDYRFVHAGVRPGVALDRQSTVDLLSIRSPFLESTENFGRVIVHGHTICATPVVRHNRIGIDTGAFRSGMLTCLVLEGSMRRFLHTAALSGAAALGPLSYRAKLS